MKINLLFVDDDSDFHSFFQKMFEKKMPADKYTLHIVDSAKNALDYINKGNPVDIVLCDVNMPEQDGFAFLTEVNEIDAIIKVIMVSATQNIATLRQAMNKDAFDFLAKPLNFTELELALERTYQHIVHLRDGKEKLDQSYEHIHQVLEQVIYSMTTIGELRDPYTAGHQYRVAQLSSAIAVEMGLPKDQVYWTYVSGLLHDIGKICIPTEILCRPGGVSLNEMSLIRDHAFAGYEILKNIDFPWPVAEIVHQHHERMDGSGYPQGLGPDEIHLEAKIIAIADTVEAISSFRPYRPAMGIDKALEILKSERGNLYDAAIVDICVELFEQNKFEFDYTMKFSNDSLADLQRYYTEPFKKVA